MRVLVTGATGFIGGKIVEALRRGGHDVVRAARGAAAAPSVHLDLAQPDALRRALDRAFELAHCDAIVHAAAERDLNAAQREPDRATLVNTTATRALARWCAHARVPLIFLSTDQVFDGSRGMYEVDDARRPINHYGVTKALAEDAVLGLPTGSGCVARVTLTLGVTPQGDRSPHEQVVRAIQTGGRANLFTDEFRTPVLAEDVALCMVELVERIRDDCLPACVHVAGKDRVSRWELGQMVVRTLERGSENISPASLRTSSTGVPRGADCSLALGRTAQVLRWRPRSLAEAVAYVVGAAGLGTE